jgi:aspartyl protease family protein
MRQLFIFAGLMLAVSAGFVRYVDRIAPAQTAPAASAMNATASANNNSRSVTVPRGRNGHFQVEGRVDGRRLEFVVDTGASQIALRESEAARLGIHPSARDYSVIVQTANGQAKAAMVRLNMVEIGDVVVRDVPALIHPDAALGVNLLGMSFLSRVKFAHDRGKLVIEQ